MHAATPDLDRISFFLLLAQLEFTASEKLVYLHKGLRDICVPVTRNPTSLNEVMLFFLHKSLQGIISRTKKGLRGKE